MKLLQITLIFAFFGIMVYGSASLPRSGEAAATRETNRNGIPKVDAGKYYIKNAYKDAGTPNIVTVVLGDYRSFDTLGEQIVIYTAGLITLLILRKRRKR